MRRWGRSAGSTRCSGRGLRGCRLGGGPRRGGGGGGAGWVVRGIDPVGPMLAAGGVDERGYLVSRDGKRLLVLISPSAPPDDPETGAALLAAVRAVFEPVAARHQGVSV